MAYAFGQLQYKMSDRMKSYPLFSRMISKFLGTTNVGQFARSRSFNRLLQEAELKEGDKVLDLGCGQGEYLFKLASGNSKVGFTGLDIEPVRINKIARIAENYGFRNVDSFCGKIEDLGEEETFDLIYSIDVFEHILEDEMPFTPAVSRLNKGGKLIVKMPSKEQLTILPQTLYKEHQEWLKEEHIGQVYELNDLTRRMEKEGLEIQYAAYGDGYISRLAWEIAYLSKKVGPLVQLVCLPFLKGMVVIDQLIHSNSMKGNTIQVIGVKK